MQDVKGQPSGMAKGALICGILSFIPPLSLVALILGIIDLVKISKQEAPEAGKKFDIIGIVLSVVVPVIFWTLISVLAIGCTAAMGGIY